MYVFLTMTLRLGAEPGPVVHASSFRWTLQRVAGFAAEADNTAYWKLFSQTDTMHGNTWISTEPGRITWKILKNIFHNDSIAHVENIRGMFSYQNNKKWFFRITTETQSPSSTWLPSNRKNNVLPQEWLASQIHFHHISMFNRQKMCNIISIVIYLFYPDIYFAPCFRLHTPCFIHVLYLKQPKTV